MSNNTEKKNSNIQIPSAPPDSHAELNNQYTFKITTESILWLKDLQDNTLTISFCNPINQKFYTIPGYVSIRLNELTYLENINCRMELEISQEKVSHFFAKWSPTIIICNKENKVLTHCSLDLKPFKCRHARERYFVTKILFDKDTEQEKLGELNVILTLYDNKMRVSIPDNTYIGIPLFFQITDQLEIWKQKQKRLFKQQEQEQINQSMKEWNRDRAKLEEKLLKNLRETNDVLQEIKSERDFIKAAIEIELNKLDTNLFEPKVDTSIKTSTAPIKKIGATTKKSSQGSSEIEELKNVISKQTYELSELKKRMQEPSPHFQLLLGLTDDLRAEIILKDQEIEYLKDQWAKTTRQLNSFKKYEKSIEAKHAATHNAMLPFMIQELLSLDSGEQKKDLDQLHSIQKELEEHRKKSVRCAKELEKTEEKSELDTLLQTRTYNKRDKVIKMLGHKKK